MFITLAIWTNKTHIAGSLRLWTGYLVIWQVYFPTYCYNAVIYKLISCVHVDAFAYMTLSLPAGFMCRMQCGLSIANLYIPGIAFHGTCNNSHFFFFNFHVVLYLSSMYMFPGTSQRTVEGGEWVWSSNDLFKDWLI